MTETDKFDSLIALTKRRGFIYPSSEIYGGLSGIYDYGHYGVLLKNKIRDYWWQAMVAERDDIYGLDSAIFMHPKTWQASGHLDNFDDPLVDCRQCRHRYRADYLLANYGIEADKATLEFINQQLDLLRQEKKLRCAECGSSDLTPARRFSLMVKSNLGSPVDDFSEDKVTYLRPETCGGIYLQYKNIIDSLHPSLPFGVAQIGKAFRNEIVAKQFIFRTREFEQMEMQYFHQPQQGAELIAKWQQERWRWYLGLGLPANKIRWQRHERLAHYATDAYDLEYNFSSLGSWKEIEGVHGRGDWDLSQHSKFSGCDLSYFAEASKQRFIPHIVETSVGLNRLLFIVLDNFYDLDEVAGESRIVLRLPNFLAPVTAAVFPLLKNKVDLTTKAQQLYRQLKKTCWVEYDDNGNIGKRYRRQDEIGTPFCLTVDFDSLLDDTVTIRYRDTAKQDRLPINEVESFLHQAVSRPE